MKTRREIEEELERKGYQRKVGDVLRMIGCSGWNIFLEEKAGIYWETNREEAERKFGKFIAVGWFCDWENLVLTIRFIRETRTPPPAD